MKIKNYGDRIRAIQKALPVYYFKYNTLIIN